MKLLAQLVISTLAVLIASFIFKGVHVSSVLTALSVAAVLALLNIIIKPLLIILTIPITIFTMGLFLLVINAFIVLLVDKIVPGFRVEGFWTAFFFSIILTVINSIFSGLNAQGGQD